jgi:putative membrane protein
MTRSGYVVAGVLMLAATTVPAQAAGPTDPQITAIVVAANQVDINAGKLAESKSGNKEVKAFAERMVTDHTGVNKQAVALDERHAHRQPMSSTDRSSARRGLSY